MSLIFEPWKRLRQWRTRRAMKSWRAEHPDEVREEFHDVPPDEGFMSEQVQSFVRGVLKVLAGALVAKGVIDVGDSTALQVAVESLIGGAAGLWAFWASHRKHAA